MNQEDAQRWFAAYLTEFEALGRGDADRRRILDHYGVPLLVSTEHGPMFFADAWHTAAIHHRNSLKQGVAIAGPARIDQTDTTTIVPPGWTARVDNLGNIAITHEAFTQ